MIPFYKAQGLGNDFVIFKLSSKIILTPPLVRNICNRKYGIGCDQVIIYHRVNSNTFKVRFYNADGSEADACGNGSRALAKLLFYKENIHDSMLYLQTAGGMLTVCKYENEQLQVSLPPPRFEWKEIPQLAPDLYVLPIQEGQISPYYTVNVGNPHLVAFFENIELIETNIGAFLETHPIFPKRINVSFAQIIASNHLKLKVWERGSGYTGACGTAACAAGVIAIKEALAYGPLFVQQAGGMLSIDWKKDLSIVMAGPATLTFQGEIDFSIFEP